jgi:hypothetical protein
VDTPYVGGKYLNRSVIEGNARIEPQSIRKQLISNSMLNRHEISLMSNSSVLEEPMSVSRRPKSSQGGINRHDLMRSANKMKSTGMKKYRKLIANPHISELPNNASEGSMKESSVQRYIDFLKLTKESKGQPKNAAFFKHFMKKKDESEIIPKLAAENLQTRKKHYKTEVLYPITVRIKDLRV